MSLVSYHSQGTASVNSGQTAVTFSGASLVSAGIQAGDYFFAQGMMMPIAAVGGQNAATLVSGWPGSNISGGNYQIVPAAEGARVALSARLVLEQLTNGNIEALAALNLVANRGVFADGAGSLALFNQTAFGRAIQNLTGANGSFIRATGAGTAAMQAIVGTASQSGGVPTGAIMERGTNANGEFTRFANGVQICTRSVTVQPNTYATPAFPASFSSNAGVECVGISGGHDADRPQGGSAFATRFRAFLATIVGIDGSSAWGSSAMTGRSTSAP